jgi:hypothetical protein
VKKFFLYLVIVAVSGCATVRQEDLDAWVGKPVVALETHPFFITVPVVKTQASDGTVIWNYVNGANIGSCSGGGSIYGRTINFSAYNQFASCVQKFAACNNIFYIKNGVIQNYTPIGTGGMRCYTNDTIKPNFRGNANVN